MKLGNYAIISIEQDFFIKMHDSMTVLNYDEKKSKKPCDLGCYLVVFGRSYVVPHSFKA